MSYVPSSAVGSNKLVDRYNNTGPISRYKYCRKFSVPAAQCPEHGPPKEYVHQELNADQQDVQPIVRDLALVTPPHVFSQRRQQANQAETIDHRRSEIVKAKELTSPIIGIWLHFKS